MADPILSFKQFEYTDGEECKDGEDGGKGSEGGCVFGSLWTSESSGSLDKLGTPMELEEGGRGDLGYGAFDDMRFSSASHVMEQCMEEIVEVRDVCREGPSAVENRDGFGTKFSFASLELLKSYGRRFKWLHGEVIKEPSVDFPCGKSDEKDLSAEEIFRVAGEMFVESSSPGASDLSSNSHPMGFHYSGVPEQQIKDIQLAGALFLAAEGVAFQQFERATRLLNHCDMLAAQDGSIVQRVVYYFSEALRERIDRQIGSYSLKGLGKLQNINMEEAFLTSNPVTLACQLQCPFSQVCQVAAVQAILENVAHAKKIHIIDFGIRNGVQWTILIQALATRDALPLELLKITAVGTTSKHMIEDCGKRLSNFAQSQNLPFAFTTLMVNDMLDLDEHLFDLDDDEAVAIYAPTLLRTLLCVPDRLEHMMRIIRVIRPCIVVVQEVEANHNSPVFGNRFTEALFYFAAYYDSIASCISSSLNRMHIESVFFGQGIRNIIATEGEARTVRNVKIDVWRAFFVRFILMEAELSSSSLYQARLVLNEFSCGHSCFLHMNGQSLIVGWKGTPLLSLSTWKFG